MATIKDVACKAGVSVSTVSHVLNHTRFVSDPLRGKVLAAVEELNYSPNPLARGLRKGTSSSIAVVLSDVVNPFFPRVVRGIEDCAKENGYNIVLCNTDESSSEEQACMSLLRSKNVDGFIVSPTSQGAETLAPASEKIVIIDRRCNELKVDQVFSDNVDGAYRAVKHLLELGHRDIGIIVEMLSISTFADRFEGYKKALSEHGVALNDAFIREAGLEIEGAYSATEALVNAFPRVSAIFSTNNLMTLGVLEYVKKNQIRFPEELSLVGFDDPEWTAVFHPGITSVAQQPYEMGYKAAEMLVNRIEGDGTPPVQVCLECELRVRESATRLYHKDA